MSFSLILKLYREYRGMTTEELAQASGLPAARLYDLESGKITRITTKQILAIAAALRVEVSDLVTPLTYGDAHKIIATAIGLINKSTVTIDLCYTVALNG